MGLTANLIILFLIVFWALPASAAESKISFWDKQRKGANFFNMVEQEERFLAARRFGIELVRLAPNKWLNGRIESQRGDFLIGRPGQFKTVNADDLKLLVKVLDDADRAGVKVVLTMLSLPDARWTQHNNDVEERKIWTDFQSQEKAIDCWRQLATALKGHPAVVGYNLRNEPSPELAEPRFKDWYLGDYQAWYAKVKDTPRDLNSFYRRTVAAIRQVDPDTPIVLDSGFYSTAWAFKVLEPVLDDKIIYSFHMYEPFEFTNFKNRKKFEYPGTVPTGEGDDPPLISWDKARLDEYFKPVIEWQKKYNIPSSRIYVGEFGVFRKNIGARNYLSDLIDQFNANNWHWCFYSFREDNWEGMDYELGTGDAGKGYWQAIELNKMPDQTIYKPNPLSGLLEEALKAN